MPTYDPAKDEELPWEDEVAAAIEKLRAEKEVGNKTKLKKSATAKKVKKTKKATKKAKNAKKTKKAKTVKKARKKSKKK